MAFVPTGMVKLLGRRFTTIGVDDPIGFFFEAMYQTGPYWRFIGASQVVAALLLLIPATATVGALLFLPIVLSIVLVTWGVGFGGTVWVTSGMLLSVGYLLCWDADRVWSAGAAVLGARGDGPLLRGANGIELAGWALGGTVGILLFLTTRDLAPAGIRAELLMAGVLGAALVVVGWAWAALGGRRDR